MTKRGMLFVVFLAIGLLMSIFLVRQVGHSVKDIRIFALLSLAGFAYLAACIIAGLYMRFEDDSTEKRTIDKMEPEWCDKLTCRFQDGEEFDTICNTCGFGDSGSNLPCLRVRCYADMGYDCHSAFMGSDISYATIIVQKYEL